MEGITAPPKIARWLLRASLPAAERESIPGDLEEEFASMAASGGGLSAARTWYCRQVWRSAAPLIVTRWRRAEIQESVVVVLLTLGVPLRALDFLWAFVLSQVPLKTDAIRPGEFLIVTVMAACILGFVCGAMRPRMAWWAGITSLACLATVPARLPVWHWLLLPLAAAGAAALANRKRATA